MIEGSPAAVRHLVVFAHRYVLGLRLRPASWAGGVLGWEIVENRPDVLRLGAASPLMSAEIVVRRPESTRLRVTTLGHFVRPVPGRAIWAAVGPVHRRVAPYLMQHAARSRSPR
jgi:hypothetical protein